MSIDDLRSNLRVAITKLVSYVKVLERNADNPLTKALAGLALVVLENAIAVERLLSANFHGGIIEIVRSQMEAAADCMLLAKDSEYLAVLIHRQNETVLRVTNRAKSKSGTMPSVAAALQNPATGKVIEQAYKHASSQKLSSDLSFVESVGRAELREDNYRYLCSFAHHNLTALNVRYFEGSKDGAYASDKIGVLPDALLEMLVRQTTANIYGVLMRLAEKGITA